MREQEGRDVLKRLETVLAGSESRGIVGENNPAAILIQFPLELLVMNPTIYKEPAEFALRLPLAACSPSTASGRLSALERLQNAEDPTRP